MCRTARTTTMHNPQLTDELRTIGHRAARALRTKRWETEAQLARKRCRASRLTASRLAIWLVGRSRGRLAYLLAREPANCMLSDIRCNTEPPRNNRASVACVAPFFEPEIRECSQASLKVKDWIRACERPRLPIELLRWTISTTAWFRSASDLSG